MKAALAASFVLAAACGWLAAGHGDPPATATGLAPAKSPDRKRAARSAHTMPPEVAARLAPLRAAKTPDERLRAMTLLAQSLPVSELAAWYEAGWIPRRETVESLQFYHITGQRWVAADGEGMLRFHFAKDRSRVNEVAREWGLQDPQAAFKFLDELKDPDQSALMDGSLAAGAAYSDPRQALARVLKYKGLAATRSLGEPGYHDSAWAAETMISAIARKAPDLLKQEAAAWPEQLRDRALNEITQASLTKDFSAGLAELAGQPDGLERFLGGRCWELKEQYAANADKLPEGWLPALLNKSTWLAELDPERWLNADYAGIGVSEGKAAALRSAAATTILYQDPARLPGILAADLKLEPAARDFLIQRALTQLYATDPAKAAQMRDQIGLAEDMDGLWGKVMTEAPSDGPPKHFDSPSQIGEIGTWSRNDKYSAVTKMQGWGEAEIQQALSAFGTLPATDRRALAETLSGWDSGTAPVPLRAESVRYLMQDQGDALVQDDHFRGYCQFASNWGSCEPAAAAHWVESLPSGESRLWMAKNVAASWGSHDPQAAAKWVDSLGLKEQLQGLGKKREGE